MARPDRPKTEPLYGNVSNNEWYSTRKTERYLKEVDRKFAERVLRSRRLLRVRNSKGQLGYYCHSVENEVEWFKRSGPLRRSWRRVADVVRALGFANRGYSGG